MKLNDNRAWTFGGNRRRARTRSLIIMIAVITLIVIAIFGTVCFRFDYAAGSHRIIPTAVDTDLWGNYQVYFKTSVLTQNTEESFYYIDKSRPDIAEQIQEAILTEQTIVVYYERYIGFKGLTAPRESPIVKVEIPITG